MTKEEEKAIDDAYYALLGNMVGVVEVDELTGERDVNTGVVDISNGIIAARRARDDMKQALRQLDTPT